MSFGSSAVFVALPSRSGVGGFYSAAWPPWLFFTLCLYVTGGILLRLLCAPGCRFVPS